MQDDILNLDDLQVIELEIDASGAPQLEALAAGHLMTEVGASAVGPGVFICSCCCCC